MAQVITGTTSTAAAITEQKKEENPPMTFTEKCVAVQTALGVAKSSTNSFAKYSYRTLDDMTTALKPLLGKHGLRLKMTSALHTEPDGSRAVTAKAIVCDGKESDEAEATVVVDFNRKGMSAEQVCGSAITYARKYALASLFAIDDGCDPDSLDNRDMGGKPAPAAPQPKPAAVPDKGALLTSVKATAQERGIPLGTLSMMAQRFYGVAKAGSLPPDKLRDFAANLPDLWAKYNHEQNDDVPF